MRSTLFTILLLAFSWPAEAATIVADGTGCTLADAIVAANTNSPTGGCPAGDDTDDTIVLDADVVLTAVEPSSTFVSGGASGLPDVDGDLTITAGLGSVIQRDPSFTCDPMTTDPTFRFLYLAAGSLVLDGLSFEDGCFVSADDPVQGGGMASASGTETELVDVWFRRHGTFATVGEIQGGVVADGGFERRFLGGGFDAIHVEAAARIRGGIFYALTDTPIVIEGTHFLDVTTTAGTSVIGGAIATGDGSLTDAVFSGFEVVAGTTISGGVLNVSPHVLTVERSAFEDLRVTANTGSVTGGAVYTNSAFAVHDTTFEGLSVSSLASSCQGGGIYGVDNAGTSVLERIVVRESTCRGTFSVGGGVYLPSGSVAVRDSLFRDNRVEYTQIGQGGGLATAASPILVERSAFVDNEVVPVGDSSTGNALGGGFSSTGTTTLRNLTVSGNRAVGADGTVAGTDGGDADGGGLWLVNGTLSHLTLEGNVAVAGAGAGGFANGEARSGGVYTANIVEMDNSILSGNSVTSADDETSAEDCWSTGGFTSNGFNLAVAPDVSCDFSTFGDIVGLDPELYPVDDYGCETPLPDGSCLPTAAIDQDSWAVDWGSCADSGAFDDARAFERRVDVVGVSNLVDACDSGAFEAQDSDGDGVTDVPDVCPGSDDAIDGDGDAVPDGCDICPGSDDAIDDDGDGVPDGCDICLGDDQTGDGDGDGVCADLDCDDTDPANACALFADGFESGDTLAWSSADP